MTQEEIIQAITDDKTMPFIQPEQLAGIVDFVIKNHQPSLPSDLDEAAEEALDDIDANWQIDERDDGCTEPGYNQKQMLLIFKAGAEWLAGQGESRECTIGIATEEIHCLLGDGAMDAIGVGPGDKVIVQIRKK